MIEESSNQDAASAREDLAFLRQMMESDTEGQWQVSFGRIYAAWGIGFAIPIFLEWLRIIGSIELPVWFWLAAVVVVTALVSVVNVVESRRSGPVRGAQARAANAIFTGIGVANGAILLALAAAAWTSGNWVILMFHGPVVFAFQGAAWYGVWALRKVAWTGLVAAGWLVAAVGLGATFTNIADFVLIAGVSLTLLMGGPGIYMAMSGKAK